MAKEHIEWIDREILECRELLRMEERRLGTEWMAKTFGPIKRAVGNWSNRNTPYGAVIPFIVHVKSVNKSIAQNHVKCEGEHIRQLFQGYILKFAFPNDAKEVYLIQNANYKGNTIYKYSDSFVCRYDTLHEHLNEIKQGESVCEIFFATDARVSIESKSIPFPEHYHYDFPRRKDWMLE